MTTAHQTANQTEEFKKITFRTRGGKAHRGLVQDGWLVAACRCPGSQNGHLTNGAQIVCDGWERATCEG